MTTWGNRDNYAYMLGVLGVFQESCGEARTSCKGALAIQGIEEIGNISGPLTGNQLSDLNQIFADGTPPQ